MGLGVGNVLADVKIQFAVRGTLPEPYLDGSASASRAFRDVGMNAGWRINRRFDANSDAPPAEALPIEVTLGSSGSLDIDLTDAAIIGALTSESVVTATETLKSKKYMGYILSTFRTDGLDNAGEVVVAPKSGGTGYHMFGDSAEDGIGLPPDTVESRITQYRSVETIRDAGASVLEVSGAEGDKINILILFQPATAIIPSALQSLTKRKRPRWLSWQENVTMERRRRVHSPPRYTFVGPLESPAPTVLFGTEWPQWLRQQVHRPEGHRRRHRRGTAGKGLVV